MANRGRGKAIEGIQYADEGMPRKRKIFMIRNKRKRYAGSSKWRITKKVMKANLVQNDKKQ